LRLTYPLFIALRYLRFHRGRRFLSLITMISVAGVCVGTAALVIALALVAGFAEDVRERIHSGSAHLTVMSYEDSRFGGGEELARRVEQVPDIVAAAPVIFTPAMVVAEGQGSTGYAEIQGIEPVSHSRVVYGEENPNSPFLLLDAPHSGRREGIVLGAELATQIGVIEGDLVRVVVPKVTLSPWGAGPRSTVFEVLGMFQSNHFEQDARRAYVHRRAAGRLLRMDDASNWIEVRVVDLRQLAAMKNRLRETLGQPWIVIDLIEQNREIFKALNTERILLFLAIGLIVIVASLNIVSTLILMVTDKVKEIGTLASMGARSKGIAAIFIFQGLVIGTTGTFAGLLLGTSVAYWLDRLRLLRLNPEVYYLTHVPFSLHANDILYVGLASLLISFLATIYPAFRASSLDPVEALRYE